MRACWKSQIVFAFIACLAARAFAADGKKLSFFITADAHIGWENKMQPNLEQQTRAMRTILSKFPAIDLFIDAGDNTYPVGDDLKGFDQMRKNWMALEPNACVGIPFLYAAGNHEIMHFRGTDPELQCAVAGSLPCRPYYSFSRKGIHIIALPEMSRTVFLSAELLAWLRLDLATHKAMTTIIVTHNSILNTTGGDEPGYRGLAQDGLLRELFKSNPQIIAWMHGHNHDYAVVPRDGMLFVSAGRLGGFSHNIIPLGGMLVEITEMGIRARAFNAETGEFLEGNNGNINRLPVSGSLARRTSFAASAKTEICFGVGRDQDGSKSPIYNHFAGGTATARITAEKDATLNDNPDFSLYAERKSANGVDRQLFGYACRVPGLGGFSVAPGALSMQIDHRPAMLMTPDRARSLSYYHAVPGKPYRATLEITAQADGGTLELSLLAGSTNAAADESSLIVTQSIPLKAGRHSYTLTGIMKTSARTTYADPQSDCIPTLVAKASITGRDLITVHSFVIARADKTPDTVPELAIGGTRLPAGTAQGGIRMAQIGGVLRNARTVVEMQGGGCSSWLISKRDVDWQVRNAAVTETDQSLIVQSLRNPWSDDEILLAPLFDIAEPFLARTHGLQSLEVFPINRGNRTLRVNVREARDGAFLVIKSASRPEAVTGARSWSYREGYVQAAVNAYSTVEVNFASQTERKDSK